MEGQGNILKTLLIAAVVYALALGVPVKRQTSSSTVTSNSSSSIVAEACAAARNTSKIVADCSPETLPTEDTYDEARAAEYLWNILPENNFTGAVCEAVRKCLNHTDSDRKKCTLAAAAIELHDTVNKFIAKNGAKPLRIDCCTSTDEVEVEKALCHACVYTQDILAGIQ